MNRRQFLAAITGVVAACFLKETHKTLHGHYYNEIIDLGGRSFTVADGSRFIGCRFMNHNGLRVSNRISATFMHCWFDASNGDAPTITFTD